MIQRLNAVFFWIALSFFASNFEHDLDWAREQMTAQKEFSTDFLHGKGTEKKVLAEELKEIMKGMPDIKEIDFEVRPEILQDPKQELGVIDVEENFEHEVWRETCEEGGDVEVKVHQILVVEEKAEDLTEHVKQQPLKRCKGHHKIRPYNGQAGFEYILHSMADYDADQWIKSLRQDPTIDPSCTVRVVIVNRNVSPHINNWVGEMGWVIHADYRHKDNAETCDCFELIDERSTGKIEIPKASEKEYWKSVDPEQLARLEADPRCQFLRAEMIDGNPLFRDLIFACEKDEVSSFCDLLREKGGELIDKRCLLTNDWGGCDKYLKTYEKNISFLKRNHVFKNGGTFFGLHGEFHKPHDKSSDFRTVSSILTTLNGLRVGETPNDVPLLFSGAPLKCHSKCSDESINDCCKKMRWDLVDQEMTGCSSEEKTLAALRMENRCHFIGSKEDSSGTTKVFCCFDSPQTRLLHETAKDGLSWGTIEAPNCQGFTREEFQRVDLSKLNYEEQPYDFDKMTEQIQAFIQSKLKQVVEQHEPS